MARSLAFWVELFTWPGTEFFHPLSHFLFSLRNLAVLLCLTSVQDCNHHWTSTIGLGDPWTRYQSIFPTTFRGTHLILSLLGRKLRIGEGGWVHQLSGANCYWGQASPAISCYPELNSVPPACDLEGVRGWQFAYSRWRTRFHPVQICENVCAYVYMHTHLYTCMCKCTCRGESMIDFIHMSRCCWEGQSTISWTHLLCMCLIASFGLWHTKTYLIHQGCTVLFPDPSN